jgi:hypothetical protein
VIYLIGSLRNPEIPKIAQQIRQHGFDVFDQWYSAGPNADDHLRDHFTAMGMNHKEILQTAAAKNIFEFDKRHILAADIVVLLMPAGKSGFLELGWAIGQGKEGYILYDKDPERVDVMFQFANGIFYSVEEFVECLKSTTNTTETRQKLLFTSVVPANGETHSAYLPDSRETYALRGIENIYSNGPNLGTWQNENSREKT